jgi:hypothetical protein
MSKAARSVFKNANLRGLISDFAECVAVLRVQLPDDSERWFLSDRSARAVVLTDYPPACARFGNLHEVVRRIARLLAKLSSPLATSTEPVRFESTEPGDEKIVLTLRKLRNANNGHPHGCALALAVYAAQGNGLQVYGGAPPDPEAADSNHSDRLLAEWDRDWRETRWLAQGPRWELGGGVAAGLPPRGAPTETAVEQRLLAAARALQGVLTVEGRAYPAQLGVKKASA